MKKITTALMYACLALAANSVSAQDTMKKSDAMHKEPSMQDCKHHMSMEKKDGMKKDDASMKMDKMCSDMMKKGDSTMMKKDSSGDTMMKK